MCVFEKKSGGKRSKFFQSFTNLCLRDTRVNAHTRTSSHTHAGHMCIQKYIRQSIWYGISFMCGVSKMQFQIAIAIAIAISYARTHKLIYVFHWRKRCSSSHPLVSAAVTAPATNHFDILIITHIDSSPFGTCIWPFCMENVLLHPFLCPRHCCFLAIRLISFFSV